MSALRSNAAIKAVGQRLAERGKAKMVIIGAAMRKLLYICFDVLKNETPFDASLHPETCHSATQHLLGPLQLDILSGGW